MLCSKCNKKEATIHYAEIVDGQIKKLDLCEQCAEEVGVGGSSTAPLSGFLSGLMEGDKQQKNVKDACPSCKMTYEDFRRTGRLGCGSCYEAFNEGLVYLIETIHKSKRHLGKVPQTAVKEFESVSKIEDLEKKLKKAIETENFEEAAKLRDEVRSLKKEGKESKK